ncbi:hypothetical protein V2W45_1420462 [Cenococcum geophilum]
MAPSPRHSLTDDNSLQKYMLLSSQQEVLRRRLSLQIPPPTPMTAFSPEMQSLSSSPVSSRPNYNSFSPEPFPISPASSRPMGAYPIPTVPGVEHRSSMGYENQSENGHKLYEINQKIKTTLTELLNTDSVKNDEKFRTWIQGRLMDAEMEMRRQRRRRSSIDREIAESIAERFEHNGFRYSP